MPRECLSVCEWVSESVLRMTLHFFLHITWSGYARAAERVLWQTRRPWQTRIACHAIRDHLAMRTLITWLWTDANILWYVVRSTVFPEAWCGANAIPFPQHLAPLELRDFIYSSANNSGRSRTTRYCLTENRKYRQRNTASLDEWKFMNLYHVPSNNIERNFSYESLWQPE